MCQQIKGHIYIYILTALCSLTLLSGFLLSSSSVSADTVDNISVSVPESCTLSTASGSGNVYNVAVLNGQYKNDIGKTRLSVFCNTNDTFAIYAVGYSNDVVGNNEMIASSTSTNDIATGTATSGDTSNWAMKVEAVAGTGASGSHVSYTPTIMSPFSNFAAVPSTWAKVAEATSVTGITNEAAVDASYAVYIAPKQPAASYTGKVRYTVVHPASVDPGAGQANLDTGSDINKKLKSLASGTNVTSQYTTDTLITAFVRSDTLPDNFTPSTANTISTSNSQEPVYVWFDNNDGTMYYYSKASEIWMNATSSSALFQYMKSLTNISGLKYFITDNATNMSWMFSDTQISDLTPIANWKVDNVTNMNTMFSNTQISDLTPIANWKVDKVTGMGSMFSNTQISDLTPIANWKVDKVTGMGSMFSNTQISDLTPITNWKVDNVTDMSGMFYGTKISDLTPITNWKVDKVTDMSGMFYGTKISDLTPIANWKVDKVTNMAYMFQSTQISDLTPIANWKVDNVTNMNYMFYSTKISDLTPIANWNTSSVTSMVNMFASIPTLTNKSVISGWNVGSVVGSTNGCGSTATYTNCFYHMFGGNTPKTNLPIFTSRPGTWDPYGTYIPNP